MVEETTLLAIQQILDGASRVLVTTHISPDGDALGSLTAWGVALRQLDKQPTLVCDDKLDERYHFLPLADEVVRKVKSKDRFDAVIVVDCGDLERSGRALKPLAKKMPPLINIDHHISNTCFGTVNLVEPHTTATAEILADLFPRLGVTIDESLATCLLTGLVTDTQAFRIPAVTANTLEVASRLVAAGADLPEITMRTLVVKPRSTIELWRVGLNNMQLSDGVAWTTLSQEEQQSVGDNGAYHDGLNNILSEIEEAAAGIVFTEREDGRVKVGFRSRPPIDVAAVATLLGGGGHRQAAGALVDGPLEEAVERVVGMMKEVLSPKS